MGLGQAVHACTSLEVQHPLGSGGDSPQPCPLSPRGAGAHPGEQGSLPSIHMMSDLVKGAN